LSSSSKNSTSGPASEAIIFEGSIYTDMVMMQKPKRKNKPIPYAERVANKTPEGQLRRGTCTYRTPDARSAALKLWNSIDISSLGEDLVMLTLKYSGSRANRLKLAPNDETTVAHIGRFDILLSDALGSAAKFLWL
jgi:hypothetical protein